LLTGWRRDPARDRLFLAGVGAAAVSLVASVDLDAGRDLRVRLDFGFATASTGLDAAGVGAGSTSVADFRPKPRAFATVERCSE
jgi:hypothetical protein